MNIKAEFDKFLAHYNGQYVEKEDLAALDQCFDLLFAWCDWIGVNRATVRTDYAAHIWDIVDTSIWDKIPNTPSAIIQKADVPIWSIKYGGYGHVGLCADDSADINYFTAFEQNDPLKSPAHLKKYNYNFVIGWLRLKPVTLTPPQGDGTAMTDDEKRALDAIEAAEAEFKQGNLEGTANFLVGQTRDKATTEKTLNDVSRELTDIKQQNLDLNTEMVQIKQEDVDAQTKELDAEKERDDYKKQLVSVQKDLDQTKLDDKHFLDELANQLSTTNNFVPSNEDNILTALKDLVVTQPITPQPVHRNPLAIAIAKVFNFLSNFKVTRK